MAAAISASSPRRRGGTESPDSPRLLSVISEEYRNRLRIPAYEEADKFSFGPVYEDSIFEIIHKYLELDTHHRVAYVGDPVGSLAQKIQDHFCLTQPVVAVTPGKVHYEPTPDRRRLLPIEIQNVGAEQYFREAAQDFPSVYSAAPFDRIIMFDAIEHIQNLRETFGYVLKTLHEFGKVLLIHRPGPLNTLPYFTDLSNRVRELDVPYINILQDIQACKADVEWELEQLPVVIPKLKWLAMLKEKFPPQVRVMSDYEVSNGIRELSEGMLKYHGETLEFIDRLMFITISHPLFDTNYPSMQRAGGSAIVPFPGMEELQFQMPITEDLKKFLVKPPPEERVKRIR
ncbi:PREDICTED: uncharacterized protein LOC109464886 [Branchiostoma belcheri]|uniref:Uncharacterized protein LOC109464886 n=1 Tax=Branchiostoma belcheri TaxID=7741 RepID=A0A6P4XZI2_BRABE|nr:PREDICTED: uncharacterized protein LOC109464886 [Branchiostoma belcheri]